MCMNIERENERKRKRERERARCKRKTLKSTYMDLWIPMKVI